MGSKSGGDVKNPARWSIVADPCFLGAARGYVGINKPTGEDLSFDQFLENVELTVINPGHPLFRPFMVRRYGANQGLPMQSALSYDHPTARWAAYQQLEEGMRVMASATYELMDELQVEVGSTISIEDLTMGVRRLWLVEGMQETHQGITLALIDVLGG